MTVQVSDRNLHEEWLNDTPAAESAYWAGLKAVLGAAQQHSERMQFAVVHLPAGTPGGKGGEFAPAAGAAGDQAPTHLTDKTRSDFATKQAYVQHLHAAGHTPKEIIDHTKYDYAQVYGAVKKAKEAGIEKGSEESKPVSVSTAPAGPVEATATPAYTQGYDAHAPRQKAIAILAEKNGMAPEAYKAALDQHAAQMLQGAGVFVRVSESGLSKILGNGRFKTAAEVPSSRKGESAGFLKKYRAVRDKFETERFGAGIPNEARPVYGYVSHDQHGQDPHGDGLFGLDSYGDIAVKMKPSVAARTTVTAGDSLSAVYDYEQVPVPLNAPNHRMFTMTENERSIRTKDGSSKGMDRKTYVATHFEPEERMLDPLKDIKDLSDTKNLQMGYFEAQVHKGVPVGDIEHVSFLGGKQPSATVAARLKKAGITWSTVGGTAA